LDVSLIEVRARVVDIIGMGDTPLATEGQIPFTPRAKRTLELALREALTLGHNYVGTEHILLGLVREGEGVGARVLRDLSGDLERVEQAIKAVLPGGSTAARRARDRRVILTIRCPACGNVLDSSGDSSPGR
jgi:ATP-dependent Clp protease ATP-binding subunit ClpC